MTKKLNLEDFKDNKEDILNSMFQSIQDGICILDSDLTIRQVNKAMENLYGKKIDLIGKKCHQIFQNRESPCEICPANNSIESRKISSKVLPLVTDGVQTGWLEVFAYPLIDESTNTAYGVVEFIRNITEKKSMEEKLLQEKEKFKTTLLSVGEGIISTDFKGNITILNKVAEDLTGWYENEAFGKPIEKVFNIFDENKENHYYKTIKSSIIKGETFKSRDYMTLISKNGNKIPVEVTVSPIKESGKKISGAVIVFKDFTEKKKIHDEILYLSLHDYLTGLYNRKSFEEKLKELDIEKNLPLTIVFGDLNGLKLINDSFGHDIGDQFLIKTGDILKKGCRKSDVISRVSGDEFAIILPRTNKEEANELIKRIKKLLKREIIKDMELSVSFGQGTKYISSEAINLVLKKAEDNMYSNKLYEGPSVRGRVIKNIVDTINSKSPREKAHSERVSELCVLMGEALKFNETDIKKLKTFALLHDIGKIAISDEILNKPGRLNEKELQEMKRHSEIGYRILSTSNDLSEIAEYALAHHERWDGKGYPKGIKETEIPLFSRICTIADAYDAMTSNRSYRKAMPKEFAIDELKNGAGYQFDPSLVSVFLDDVLPKVGNEVIIGNVFSQIEN